jgi:hypothetical protein
MHEIVGERDLILVTLDTLRFDVAHRLRAEGRTPNLARLLPEWERRHSPGSFTYAAHHAFFAGFLPTPARPGRHPRLFAMRFEGSETTGRGTFVFDAPDLVTGLRGLGYHTICVGGVGFFNKQNPLGNVLPSLFDESHWSPSLGVTDPRSTENQVRVATSALERLGSTERDAEKRAFLFLNVSALHQPNRFYVPGATRDDLESHAAALEYVDAQLPPLVDAVRRRGPSFWIVCSDHGTAYGEDGFEGHRLAHPVVWDVPYAEALLDARLDA